MDINGIQKLTLLDYPGKVACTVFLAGCDLKCPFCHNSELWSVNAPAVMDDKELLAFLEKRRGMLEGVAFTGGEPLLRPELPEVMTKIKELGFAVKLDTNGTHPDKLRALIGEGLVDRVAMDIKNDPERYALTCGREAQGFPMDAIRKSIEILMNGGIEYEFRTTAVKPLHDADSFRGIGEMIRGAEEYYIQPFADRDTVLFSGFETPAKEELESWLGIVEPFVKRARIRGM
ncbi:MAG: anaerobic ribonucleoside-triphosphate reductase activating protein [Clostridia bacterium]|nr:anaerobic ribonucleoside-triphosphate reductase activating protein [Clostridia bacterium]